MDWMINDNDRYVSRKTWQVYFPDQKVTFQKLKGSWHMLAREGATDIVQDMATVLDCQDGQTAQRRTHYAQFFEFSNARSECIEQFPVPPFLGRRKSVVVALIFGELSHKSLHISSWEDDVFPLPLSFPVSFPEVLRF